MTTSFRIRLPFLSQADNRMPDLGRYSGNSGCTDGNHVALAPVVTFHLIGGISCCHAGLSQLIGWNQDTIDSGQMERNASLQIPPLAENGLDAGDPLSSRHRRL